MLKSVRMLASRSSQCSLSELEAVDPAPFVNEVPHGAEDRIVLFHIGDPVIFGHRFSQLRFEHVIRRIADAENRGARLLQPVTEVGPVGRKMRREEDKVHRKNPLRSDDAVECGRFARNGEGMSWPVLAKR